MTGLAGLFFRDGRNAHLDDLSVIAESISCRGLGATATYLDGHCGFAVAELPTTPESVAAPQPARDPVSRVVVICDGRLDDRGRLVGVLRDAGADVSPDASDAHLILAAYLRLGEDFASRLIGDFALAVWDPRRQRLTCARDAMGIRPLYYAIGRSYFVFGSSPRAILLHEGVPKRLNHAFLGEYLAGVFCSRHETFYAGVQRLQPAHLIRVDRWNAVVARYWDFDPNHRIRYRDARDYAPHFRELFRRAVKDRLRCVDPIGVFLSGGIDSSAVAGVTQEALDDEGAGVRLRAYSNIYPGEACDETRFIDAVVDRWGLISKRFPWAGFDSSPWLQQASQYLDIPDTPSLTSLIALLRGARADGVRVLLTGEGGDYWQQGSQLPHRHMLRALEFGLLIREVRYRADCTGWRNALRLAAGGLLWGLAPGKLRRWIESLRLGAPLPPFLCARFFREIGLEQRRHCADCAERFPDASQWQVVKNGCNGYSVHASEMIERNMADRGLELRHPLLDRRLIEFAVAVPDQVKRRGPLDRYTMRQALSEVYPDVVRERRDYARFDLVYMRALLMPQVQEVLASPALRARPWIEADVYPQFLEKILAECRAGTFTDPRSRHYLWMLFAVEVWYRQVFGA